MAFQKRIAVSIAFLGVEGSNSPTIDRSASIVLFSSPANTEHNEALNVFKGRCVISNYRNTRSAGMVT